MWLADRGDARVTVSCFRRRPRGRWRWWSGERQENVARRGLRRVNYARIGEEIWSTAGRGGSWLVEFFTGTVKT